MGAIAVSFAAGALSVLSPCVLPLLPIVVASALQRHRHGPLALATGFVLASAAIGLFFASLGFRLGVDRDTARGVAAVMMAGAGLTLLLPPLQRAFAAAAAPLAGRASAFATRLPAGLGGQLLLGVLLGAVWTPCTGPTLAAAIAVAARSESLARAGAVMLVFGAGAVVPVLALAYGSRHALRGHGRRLAHVASAGKAILGLLLLIVGVLALTGIDKRIEAWMVEHMPNWVIDLTTAI
jgi:cytochrome c biogenesis protein CcdA